MRLTIAIAACVLASAIPACSSSDDGEGTATFTTYGEDYIEKEIPSDTFEDGWSVKYDRFLVVIGDVKVAEEGGAPAATMTAPKVFDMTKAPGDKLVASFPKLPAKAYSHVSYTIAPATAAAEVGSGATDADKQLMVSNGYSVYVEATATKAGASKKFTWGFKTNTLYDRCKSEESGKETDGIVVTNGGTESVQLTIHGDHLYYDDLQSKEAKVRFDNIAAADADNDNNVTLEELAAVKLAALPSANGPYGTGSAAGINDLRAFVEALSRTVGHFRGEGECLASAR